jgi:curli biogenesis system outer membrane secretion channel CsgG
MKPLSLILVGAALLTGCRSIHQDPYVYRSKGKAHHKPVVAVLQFENRANFHGQWNLGDGMADLLTTRILASDRFVVIERKQLDSMIREIRMQGGDLFRAEGRVEPGRLKNAQYLIRGVVTDFTVTNDASGWFAQTEGGIKLLGSKARVAVNILVFDVESGEIVSSVETSGSAGSIGLGGGIHYKDYRFGSDAFFRTPLGKASTQAMKKAIDQMLTDIPHQEWKPRIAEATPDSVIISGGSALGVREGSHYAVRGQPRAVTDPTTGDVIERIPGPVKGRVEVVTVNKRSAHALLRQGSAERGDLLELVEEK